MRIKGLPENYPLIQEDILCACGCGTKIERYYLSGKRWHERLYVHNHHRRGATNNQRQKDSVQAITKTKSWHDQLILGLEKRKNNPNWIESSSGKKAITARWSKIPKAKTYLWCSWCNQPFVKSQGTIRNPNLSFCCNNHKYNYFSGDNHHNYSGGVKLYPRQWTRKLRTEIRKRDGNRCLICEEINRRFLVIHHIDENKDNCNIDNLVTLCRSCHMKVHANSIALPENI